MLTNITGLTREFTTRAKQLNLAVDCPMDGRFDAQIVVIAEAPGEQEKRMRIPLVGGSGQLFWKAMRKHLNVQRTYIYTTNVSKRQVSLSSKGNERIPIPAHELEQWKALLLWELQQLPNMRFIICLGGVCLNALMPFLYDDDGNKITSSAGVTLWRGSVLILHLGDRRIKVLVTFNPAMVLREPKNEIVFHFDIGKFRRLVDGSYKTYQITHHINPSFREALEWIDKAHDSSIPVSVDIEVVSGETACVGLSTDNHEGYCINLRTVDANRYSLFEESKLLRRLGRLFADSNVQFIMQNGSYDCSWMWFKDALRVHHVWFDTLLAHHTLYSQLPHALAFLTSQYTDHPFYKDEGRNWREGGNIDDYWRYNVKDICITRYIAQCLHTELRAANLEDFFFSHVMRLQWHLVRMGVGGIKSDNALKSYIINYMRDDLEKLLTKFHEAVHEATGDPEYSPNPLSWQQLQDLFFRRLKLIGRGVSTGADNRKRMRSHHKTSTEASLMIDVLDKYKKEHKFFSTYADSTIDPDGRFRCEYKQFGTQKAPGRLSSAQTGWHTGMNLQNQPERSKTMFASDDGYAFGYFDLAQAEARFVGWDANIETWIADFERARLEPGSYDCHRALAAQMFGVPYEEIPAFDHFPDGSFTRRFIGKRCRHGLNYRMQVLRLAITTGLSYYEAEQAYNMYHCITPELARENGWWDTIIKTVKRDKILYNAFGRRLIILERTTDEALESIIAFRPQSTIGDKVNKVIYQSEDDDRWPSDARISLNIQDALVCMAPEAKIKTCLSIMRKYAEEPIRWPSIVTKQMCELIIPADCKASNKKTSWRVNEGELEFYDDDNGVHRWSHMKTIEVEKAA